MNQRAGDHLSIQHEPELTDATLVLAFSGWMDGGDVSTGTVRRLVDLLEAGPFAEIDPDPYYIYNFPGSMELTAIFRPPIEIEDGLLKSMEMPHNVFHCYEPANLILFLGKEPNLRWESFGNCVFQLAKQCKVQRILFVGSFGGTVPHTREPRLHVTCSSPELLTEMQKFGMRRTGYEGPGSFTSYLMTKASESGLPMTSLVAEIPSYLQGTNPLSIEAVTRRLAKILKLPLALDSLRSESTKWELDVSTAIEDDQELAAKVRELEEQYDNELLELDEEQLD